MNVVAEFFNNLAPTWDQGLEPTGAKHMTTAFLAGVKEGSRVLDLGCGTGIMELAYLRLGAGEVVALDVAPGMIDIARQKFADEPRVRFECQDVLEFEDAEGFDAVVLYNCYPHFMDKPALVAKVASLLKPQGRFIVAHGMSRAQINSHHNTVPDGVRTELMPVKESARQWKDRFAIDLLMDGGHYFCFGGSLLR